MTPPKNPLRKLFTPSATERLRDPDFSSTDRPVTLRATYAVVRLDLPWDEGEPSPEEMEQARAVHSRLVAHALKHGWRWDTLLGPYLLFQCTPWGESSAERNAVLTARTALLSLPTGTTPGAEEPVTAAFGLATGPAAIADWGCEDRACCAPLGPAVNRALALAQEARPGEIALDEATFTALGDLTRYPWKDLHFTRREPSRGGVWLLSE